MATKASTKLPTYELFVSVTANGLPLPATKVTINKVSQTWVLPDTSNHEAYYLGIVEILAEAIQNGATSVLIIMGDQTSMRQLTGLNQRRNQGMRVLYESVKRLETRIPGGVSYK